MNVMSIPSQFENSSQISKLYQANTQRGYLVGCDGGRSVIRKAAGIEFPGWDPSTSWLIAEVEMDEEPELGMREVVASAGRTEGQYGSY
jgi:3-(3-hydroxy-phenyl)propionate hydroxylase